MMKRGGSLLPVQGAERLRQTLHQGRQKRPAVGPVGPREPPRKQLPQDRVGLQPLVERVIGLEAQQRLKDRQAEDLAVVHVRRRAGSRKEFPGPRGEAGFLQGVVQGGVQRDDPLFQVQRFAGPRHGALPPQGPHATDIGRSSIELQGRQSLTYPRTGARPTLL